MPRKSTHAPLRVIASPDPFLTGTIDLTLPSGGSILDIIKASGADKALIGGAHVWICDAAMTQEPVEIPRENWHRVYPKPGTVVSIRVVPSGGGGGGGKNPLRIVLTIVVMIVAWWVGGLVAGAMNAAGYSATAASIGQGLAAAAVTLVGNAIVNAVVPVTPPKLSEMSGGFNATSPTQAISSTQNQANPMGPIPAMFGTAHMYPLFAAVPYTEILGNEQYVRELFELGYGPVEIAEERIGAVPLAQFEGVESEFRAGHDDDAAVTLYANTIREDSYNMQLTAAGGARTLETRDGADEVSGDFAFQGLVTFDNYGNRQTRTVEVKVEYRAAGSADPFVTDGMMTADGAAVEGGIYTVTAATEQIVRAPFRFKPAAQGRWEVQFTRLTADTTSTQIRDASYVTALRTITYTPPATPAGRARKALRIKATNQLNGYVQSYNCVVTRLLPTWDGAAWTAPVATSNPAWVALAILRCPRKGNAKPLADSRLDLETWLAFAERNDVPDQNGEPMYRFDGVIDTRGTVREVVNQVLATARASLAIRDGKWSVIWERPQAAAKQMFTPRNSWGFEYERTFVDMPHALKMRFVNPEKDWQKDEVIVYDDGYDETTATLFETIEQWGVVRSSQAWREGRFRMAEAKLRPGTYKLSVDVEHLQATRGDLVRVASRLMRWGLGEGRIKTMTVDGDGNVTSLTLDARLLLEAGKSYGLRIRKADGTQIIATPATPAEATETAVLALAPAIAAAEAPAEGDLAAFGEAGRETVDLIVRGIGRLDSNHARLHLVDAAPELQTVDTGPIPPFQTQATWPGQGANTAPAAPIVDSVVSDERAMVPAAGGGWQQFIRVSLVRKSGIAVPLDAIVAQWRRTGSGDAWSKASYPPLSAAIDLGPLEEGGTYDVQLWNVSGGARPGVPSTITTIHAHHVIGRSASPPKPVATLQAGTVDAPAYQAPWDLAGFRVSYKPGDDRVADGAVSLHPASPTVALPFDVSQLPDGTVTLFVVAVDTSGNESAPAIIVKDIGGPVVANVVETVDWQAQGWPGEIAGAVVDGGELAAVNLAPFVPASGPFVPAADSASFVPDDAEGSFAALSYTTSLDARPAWLPAQLTLSRELQGQAAIDYRTDLDDGWIAAEDESPFVPVDDGAPFVPDLGPWRPWPGAIPLEPQTYQVRLQIPGGPVQGRIRALAAVADVEDVDELFLNFAVAEGGTRLPLTRDYKIGVADVGLTLLADGGAAVSARATLDGIAPGPLIECLSGAGASVAGRVNARPVGA